MRHPVTRLLFVLVFCALAVREFIAKDGYWGGVFTAMWVVLAINEAGELLFWYWRRP